VGRGARRALVARWGLAGSKVLPASTAGVPGWRRAGREEAGLTLAVARRAGVEWGVGAGAHPALGEKGLRRAAQRSCGSRQRRGRWLWRSVKAERGNHHTVEKNSAGEGGVPFLKGRLVGRQRRGAG
jgi:hypothetical protein